MCHHPKLKILVLTHRCPPSRVDHGGCTLWDIFYFCAPSPIISTSSEVGESEEDVLWKRAAMNNTWITLVEEMAIKREECLVCSLGPYDSSGGMPLLANPLDSTGMVLDMGYSRRNHTTWPWKDIIWFNCTNCVNWPPPRGVASCSSTWSSGGGASLLQSLW